MFRSTKQNKDTLTRTFTHTHTLEMHNSQCIADAVGCGRGCGFGCAGYVSVPMLARTLQRSPKLNSLERAVGCVAGNYK